MANSIAEESPTEHPDGVTHSGWVERFPWLAQGTTGRGAPDQPFDLALFGARARSADAMSAWSRLRSQVGLPRAVHAHQVHGAVVRAHGDGPPGLFVAEPCDGHATRSPGVLLTVTVADCVPAFLVDPVQRAVAIVHAGWRGVAAGVFESSAGLLRDRFGSRVEDLVVHLGPAICADCYEVGPEVFEGLGLPAPAGPTHLDLRAALSDRVLAAGVTPGDVSVSSRCTRCGTGHFSHRGGDAERQVGYIGIRR